MIRGFFAAASGMLSQQRSIDVISNNISNVNTNGFKSKRAVFKDLVYSDIESRRVADPPNLQIGNGARFGASLRSFIQGALVQTQQPLDVAIAGDGFFAVAADDGTLRYTREGSFNLSVVSTEDGIVSRLTNAQGMYVLNSEGTPIELPNGVDPSMLSIGENGDLLVRSSNGENTNLGQIAIVDFTNPQGLEAIGSNLFAETVASGEGATSEGFTLRQGYIEASNVDIADEMTRLILAQRAYQLNARVLQTADDMEGIANNLRR